MSRETAVLITLVAYKVILIAIGILAQRRTRDGLDYFLGGRRLGPIVASISASARSSSAWTLLGVSGFAYAFGVSAVWLFPACVGGFALNWYVLARPLREISHRTGAVTATEVIAGDAPPRPRAAISIIASLIIIVSLATYVASQFQGAGKTLAETFDLSMTGSVLIGSAIVVFYTLLGGFWAVSLTDALQGIVMAVTAVALPVAALMWVGPGALVEGLGAVEVEGYASVWRGSAPAAALGFVLGLLGIGIGYPGQPHVVNRFMALRSGEAEMRTARRVAVGWAVLVYAGMIVLGLCARVGLADLVDGERAFIAVAGEVFPPVLAGIMIAAVLSAVMSTADSQLLVAAASVAHDLRLGGGTARSMLWRSRLVVLGLSVAAVAAALAVDETIFDRVLFAWASMGCAFGPLLLVIALRGPVSPAGTIASMVLGFTLSVGAYVAKQLDLLGSWAGVMERIVPFVVALIVALAASTPRRRGPRE
jgi:sodium/proline symporter